MPQPLKRFGSIVLEPHDALQREPTLAAHIGTIAGMWTAVEVTLGRILVFLLKAEASAAAEAYSCLVGAGPRFDILRVLAKTRLPPDLFEQFDVLLKDIRKRMGERNTIVHGLWCYSVDHPGALILADPAERITDFGRIITMAFVHSVRLPHKAPRFMVYRAPDFVAIQQRIRTLHEKLYDFNSEVMNLPHRGP